MAASNLSPPTPTEYGLYEKVSYYYYDFWQDNSHPVTGRLPLVDGGPWKLFGLIWLYYMFVRHWGPAYMKNRPAYDLKKWMLVHNIFLVLLNGICFSIAVPFSTFGLTTWTCKKYDHTSSYAGEHILMLMGYTYYVSKFLDLADTVFFVLRKKQRNVSGLHVFHHSVMPVAGWVGLKFSAYHCAGFIPFVNAFIHTIMYTYYALAALGRHDILWWKKYLTQMQMVQFVAITCHAIFFLRWTMFDNGCDWPKIFPILEGIHGALFFHLFFSFYRHNYMGSKSQLTTTPTKPSGDVVMAGNRKEKSS